MRGSAATSRIISALVDCQLHGCARRHVTSRPPCFTTQLSRRRHVPPHTQVRHFLGITKWSSEDNNKDVNLDAGVRQMTELITATRTQVRPPPPYILAKAYMKFIGTRLENPDILTLEQVQLLHATIEHLVGKYWEATGAVKTALQPSTLQDTLAFVASSCWEQNASERVRRFARFVYETLCRRAAEDAGTDEAVIPDADAVVSYISILSASNASTEALKLLDECWEDHLDHDDIRPWVDILRGFTKESDSEMVNKTVEIMRSRHILESSSVALEQVNQALTASDRTLLSAQALSQALSQGPEQSASLINAAIHQAVNKGRVTEATQFLATLLNGGVTAEHLDAVLLVAAAAGQDAKHISRKLQDSVSANPELRKAVSAKTFTPLMRYALKQSRLEDVDVYVDLMRNYSIDKDATTYILWMSSRLQKGDVQGAVSLYEKLENETTDENLDIPALNDLITRLCLVSKKKFDHDIIFSLVDRLLESKGLVEARTVAVLCTFMLSQQDTVGVTDLLEHAMGSFGVSDQDTIRSVLVSYIQDPQESSDRSWEIYELLVRVFPSTSVPTRTSIMQAFFAKERPDYAGLVFGHMRAVDLGGLRPNKDTYVKCLRGIAQVPHEETLRMVHNMLKMDMKIKLDTEIMDALMLAYTACGDPTTAMDHFEEILASEEGPSEQSLLIFFRICETHPDGRKEATDMLAKLSELDMRIDRHMYTGYAVALASHGDLEGATTALRTMASRIGEDPDVVTMASVHNALPAELLKTQFEEWAKAVFPQLWTAVEALEQEEALGGGRRFRIEPAQQIGAEP